MTWNRQDVAHTADEIVIGFARNDRESASQATRAAIVQALPDGSRIVETTNAGTAVVEVPEGADLQTVMRTLAEHPGVEFAEPNVVHEIALLPGEYATPEQLRQAQWGLAAIGCPEAWDETTGDPDVVIAVVDSGLAGPERVPDMVYRWWSGGVKDHFYTTDPLGEAAHGPHYQYEGAPFRLFPAGTSQTAPLFRWYNGTVYDHFYTTDPNGELAPGAGYAAEGITGYVDARSGPYLSHPDLSNTGRHAFGRDHVHQDNFPVDDCGHGTHVTGIASADTDNSTGVAGVSWRSSVLQYKVFDRDGTARNSDVAAAFIAAADHADASGRRVVINYSGRALAATETMGRAVQYALDHGCVLVAATGNDADNPNGSPAPVGWPAAFAATHENVIAVGAVNDAAGLAGFSNTGPEVTVVAPGVTVQSTVPNYPTTFNPSAQQYTAWDGTSMAAPHVTGVAALLLARNGALTPRRIRDILTTTADHLGTAGHNDQFGSGRINAARAVRSLRNGTVFRFWNANTTDHFYTADANGELADAAGYTYEGAGFQLLSPDTPGTTPLYRWWNDKAGDHFYTTDPNGEVAPQNGYVAEGVLGTIATTAGPGTVALHRWYHGQAVDHFYTTDPDGELARPAGYDYEGVVGYVHPGP
jgi:subtilisin family serine protease